MTDQAALLWAYGVSTEKVLTRLLEKKLIDPEDAEKISTQLYDQLDEKHLEIFRTSGGCAEIFRTYWKLD